MTHQPQVNLVDLVVVDGQGAGLGNRVTGTTNPAPSQGNDGGDSNPTGAGGGGGAGAAGSDGSSNTGGAGGAGLPYSIANGTATFYAGGGGGGTRTGGTGGSGGNGGGGDGGVTNNGGDGTDGTGGGGGGGGYRTSPIRSGGGGKGGSGVVVVRYEILQSQTDTRKATGGAISFYGDKTIHTFTSSGTFTNTSGSPLSIEYVVLAGGGSGGGKDNGGGGGAGGYTTSTATCPTSPVTVTIGGGARLVEE